MKNYYESNTPVSYIYTVYYVPEDLVLYHPVYMGTLLVKPRVKKHSQAM